MFKFEQLKVYQDGLLFVKQVYLVTSKWPKAELYGLSDQLKRAAVSIVLNIAEGASRTGRDFSHFLSNARGSVYECVAVLTIARDQDYITTMQYNSLYNKCLELSKMITGLRKYLSK